MTTIAGKTVLLTGASGGIGICIARALVTEKATIIGVARSQTHLDKVSAEIQNLGGQWIDIPFDITQVEKLPVLLNKINQIADSIDILINNAGIEIYRPFQDYSLAEMQSVLSTNLLAAMELSRLLLPNMLSHRSGHIVNMASLSAKKGHPYDSIYSASKAGLLMWSDALRQELVGTGVEVSTICPGYVSQQGMLADTRVPAPKLSGITTPTNTAKAVIMAIKQNQAESLINQDLMTETLTKLLFAIGQFYPRFGDAVYRWIGVSNLNQMRIQNQTQTPQLKVGGD
jgi:short-subunit dehydrogenase